MTISSLPCGGPSAEENAGELGGHLVAAEIDQKLRAELFAPKDITPEEADALAAQNNEEEDDLALLDEDI